MTTKITVEVPSSADYRVAVTTETPPLRGRLIHFVEPGEGKRVVGIEEVDK